MLKRKFEETLDENATSSNGHSESDNSVCSADSLDVPQLPVTPGPPPSKRVKKKVNFKGVSVFYFPRRQGFTCVPSEGGSTLGMSEKHAYTKDFTLSDYSKEQKRLHRAILAEQRRQGKMFPSPLLASSLSSLNNEEDVSSGSESDSEYDDYYFLQPLPIRQRRVLLRTAGIKKIDNEEKDECRDIRVSRNVCGCDCKIFCDPSTCSCSLAGIQCQVDRLSFPCGCTKDGCNNPAGRIEFNPIRVRTHFIHTLMRLELERSDSQDGGLGASQRSMEAAGEVDVLGPHGKDTDVVGAANCEDVLDDSGSCGTTDASSNDGAKVLKSRLKSKRTEVIDLNMFNSNEKGSCRDCQNTDMCNVMMHDVKFTMVNQQHRQQQQRAIAMGAQPGYPGPQHHHLGLSSGLSLLHPPPPLPPHQQPSSQHMLLFNDGEEEIYHSENTSSVYFDNNDSSYSEMSDTSPDILDSRPFCHVNQSSFSGKFPVSPSQMFPSSISAISSSGSGHVHSQSMAMSKHGSLNSNCLESLQVSGGCVVGPSSTSCGSVEQQHCGLTHQQSPAVMATQSLLRPPFLPGVPRLSPGQCVGALGTLTQTHTPNGHLTRTHMDNNLDHDTADNSLMLQRAAPGYQGKFSDIMETPVHTAGPPSSYKLDTPLQANKTFSLSSSAVTGTDYLNQSSQSNFCVATTSVDFGSPTTSSVSTSFQPLQTVQHPSCWSSSLASPTLRECLGLGSLSPEAVSSSQDQRAAHLEISCSSTYQQESESCAVTLSPASPNSSTITYATMTATTRDQIAAHCPGISSHMDGRSEPPTSTMSDSAPSFASYNMTTTDSSVVTSQNLLYDLPYPETSVMESCSEISIPTAEQSQQSTTCLMSNYSQSLPPPLSNSSSSPTLLASELSNTSNLPLAVVTPAPDSSMTSANSLIVDDPTSLNQLPAHAGGLGTFVSTSGSVNHQNFEEAELPNVSFASEEVKEGKDSLKNVCTSNKIVSECPDTVESHLSLWSSQCDKEEITSWNEGKKRLANVICGSLPPEIPEVDYEQDRSYEVCPTDSEVVSSLSSSTVQSTASSSTSSSSSSPTSEEDKEQAMSQDFGEIIKESIVEMVLV